MDFEVAIMSSWVVEKWNNFDTKSSLSLYKAYLEFSNFLAIENIAYTSQMVFSSLYMELQVGSK